MKVLKLSKKNQTSVIGEAIKVLQSGGTIVYPTETAYGLGADFLNLSAAKKIYKIKGRNFKKPLSIIVSNLAMAKKTVIFNKISLELAKKYWPGALTLVLKSKKTTGKFIGLRISSNKIASQIAKKLRCPIFATSANLSGKKECYSTKSIINQFVNNKYQPDLVIDAGKLLRQKVSTVVKVDGQRIEVLRKGQIII